LILPEFQNELFEAAAQIVSRRCLKEGMQMVLAVSEDDPDAEYKHVLALREARALGIILTPTPGMLDKTAALLQSIPLVQYSRRHPRLTAPAVSTDGKLGHRRIAYVGMECDKSTGAERLAGFLKAHTEFRIPADPTLRRLGPALADFARAAVGDLLHRSDAPTALVLGSTAMTFGALKAVRSAGLSMPADISLIGFGDPSWYALLSPGLTTIHFPVNEMAEAAAAQLMRQLTQATPSNEPPTHIAIEPSFLLRGTTAAPNRPASSKRPGRRSSASARSSSLRA
jgi:LacI family transcriptional regulator